MEEFVKWFLLMMIALRWIAFGYVISKHGEEKGKEHYNGYSHFLGTLMWCLIAYVIWFN